MNELTRKQAFNLSILKWEAIVKDGGIEGRNFYTIMSRLEGLQNECGLCERYLYPAHNCSKCPINQELYDGCFSDKHIFSKWLNNKNWINAKAVLNLIKSKANE